MVRNFMFKSRMVLEGRSALWEIFWVAAIKSCQDTSVFTCFPAMFLQRVVDLWLSLEEFGIQKSINKLHWSVMWGCHCDGWDTNAFRTVCEGKASAHANDKGRCKYSVQDAPLGEAATAEIFILESCSLCIEMCWYCDIQKSFVE